MVVLSAAELHCFVWGCLIQKEIGSNTVVLFHGGWASQYYENALDLAKQRTDLVFPKIPRRLSLSHAKFSKEVAGVTKKSLKTLAKCVKNFDPEVGQKSHMLVKRKQLNSDDEAVLYHLLLYTITTFDRSFNNVIFSPHTWLNQLCSCAPCQLITTTECSVDDFLGILRPFVESKNK